MASMRRVVTAAGILSALTVLAGCAPAGNSVTITYDRDGETKTVTYGVPDVDCDDHVASIMRIEKPVGFFMAVWIGDLVTLKGWLNSDKFVLFEGDGTREFDADTETYTFAAEGTVKETDSVSQEKEPEELVEDAVTYEGSIVATVRCSDEDNS